MDKSKTRVNKMYMVEVFNKFPVLQHFCVVKFYTLGKIIKGMIYLSMKRGNGVR